ncbi:hypothetical protein EJ05DRAFT_504015 [Pseudovirgaria hyperparasitica]|uniref:Uncharacterized protein n=1 Tax=Pseudovirgaria hyperparasitica TaxID=470096 RepID=A0A6A6VXE1_9PEZI|nr:uncharacterized protein EJ05DRAFT_504015 [Pseudovirgaria hyperparasitica]KAF2754476.1 hypothetical protein EJ05DRAFT_504015 [Pseudovirgaria hyperparasitica]
MDHSREAPWAEHEKTYLFAEILKGSLSSPALFAIIRDNHIQPRWTEIALPPGRSLRSCQTAFSEFIGADHRALPLQPQPTPLLNPVQDLPRKRPIHPDLAPSSARPLQPRPPIAYSNDPYGSPYAASSMGEPAHKKKRGRPTKAEAQQRAHDAMLRGEVYPPPNKKKPARPSVTGSDGGTTPVAGASSANPFERASTPPQPPMEVEETSSGKRRRTRPTRSELSERHSEHGMQPLASPRQSHSSRPDTGRAPYHQSAPPEEQGSITERRDIRMEGAEEFSTPQAQIETLYPLHHTSQQQPQQQQQQQQASSAPSLPPPPPPRPQSQSSQQTPTSRSFKETVGM